MEIKGIVINGTEIEVLHANGSSDYFDRESDNAETWNHKNAETGAVAVLSNAEVAAALLTAVSNCLPGLNFSSPTPQQQPTEEKIQPGQFV
jgi:hypothetical protein